MSEPRYIFVFSPNNSGTTALCQYIETQTDGYLPKFGNNEGHRIPEVRDLIGPRPWDPSTSIDWHSVKLAWDKRCIMAGKDLFIEGSPPNLLRHDEIREVFGEDSFFIAFISTPYMQIASSIYNYRTPENFKVAGIARDWLRKARRIKEIVETYDDVPLLYYEEFCEDPASVNKLLNIPIVEDYQITGKNNTRINEIRDTSLATIAFLYEEEINEISNALRQEKGVFDFFGYDIIDGTQLTEALLLNADDFDAGRIRRKTWEKAGGRPDKVLKRSAVAENVRGVAPK